jgi:CheY-like chemotaxis protein
LRAHRQGFIVPRILVADDNTNIQKMVALAFEERHVDVVAVGNGEAAVRRIPDANPDLILADVFMPVRNGYEVCEFVKKDTRFAHIPVILLVGAFDPLDEKEARRVGADGVLKKPFVPPDPLIAMVMSALEKNPKVAAELAKAREVPVAPPEPPMPAMEIPAKAEPKPLPEFPEPTPEEAAAIYGFGKGVRSLDDEDVASAKGPKSPVAETEEQEEEFDGSSTANDWRRKSGMDIEIPDNVASQPAFSYGRDMSPITFPSERDVPPRKVHVADEEEEQAPAAKFSSPSANDRKALPSMQDDFIQPEVQHADPVTAMPPVHEQIAKHEPAPDPSSSSTGSWMDIMAPSGSNYQNRHWMSNVDAPHSEPAAPEIPASSSPAAHTVEEPAAEFSTVSDHEAAATDDEQPKKKSWFTDAVEAVRDAVQSVVQESGPEEAVAETDQTIQADIHTPSHEPAPQPSASASHSGTHELISAPADTNTSHRDPALELPPSARVTPEPLLVKDEPAGPSEYAKRPEASAPMHSFLAPPPKNPFGDTPHASEEESAFFAPASHETEPQVFGERIPTAPPPNREALSEIPFLIPPANSTMDSGRADSETVDAVVARVLEKLEPQLHDLLSKGVLKPLVENLLQSELAKKEK